MDHYKVGFTPQGGSAFLVQTFHKLVVSEEKTRCIFENLC